MGLIAHWLLVSHKIAASTAGYPGVRRNIGVGSCADRLNRPAATSARGPRYSAVSVLVTAAGRVGDPRRPADARGDRHHDDRPQPARPVLGGSEPLDTRTHCPSLAGNISERQSGANSTRQPVGSSYRTRFRSSGEVRSPMDTSWIGNERLRACTGLRPATRAGAPRWGRCSTRSGGPARRSQPTPPPSGSMAPSGSKAPSDSKAIRWH